jgi:hypothetical protein
MHSADASFKTLIHYGLQLAAKVIARDNLNLGPSAISLAAAARLRRGLHALHAYVRRVLILLALEIEHDMTPDNSEHPRRMGPREAGIKTTSIPLFPCHAPRNDFFFDTHISPRKQSPTSINPAPLIDRWRALKDLLENPDKRARRLAIHMARKHEGMILPPDLYGAAIRNRDGTELSSLYACMAHDIQTQSRARPPPLGPRPRPPPRIRRL